MKSIAQVFPAASTWWAPALVACAAMGLCSVAAAQGATPGNYRLGTNLSEVVDYSNQVPFIDLMKMGREWFTSNNATFDTNEAHLLLKDSDGWPTSITPATLVPVQFNKICTLIFSMGPVQGGPAAGGLPYPAGQYVVRYDGQGTLEYRLAARHNAALSAPGRDVIDVTPQEPGIQICITATGAQPNHLRNIRVYAPGHEALANAGELFNPEFLARTQGFTVLRFMDWMRTNNSTQSDAAQRARTGDYTYTTAKGVPADVMADLATRLGAMPWFNMPHAATDAWVTDFATAVRGRLPAGRPVYVEYSNEIWNNQFSQGNAIEQQGIAKFGNQAGSNFDRRLNQFGERSAQICQLWRAVFAPTPERVRCVMGGQAANTYIAETALTCPMSSLKPCKSKGFHALAIAPYVGDHVGLGQHEAAVQAWTTQADGGLAKLFNELNTGTELNSSESGALPTVRSRISNHATLAQQQGVQLVAYEGGQHLVGVGAPANNNAINTLMDAANRDTRMGTLYTSYLSEWQQRGGGLFMHFADVGSASRFGRWGALELVTQTHSPKFDALMAQAQTIHTTRSTCLFDWAASVAPTLFAGAASNGESAPFRYRQYAGTGNVLATSSTDRHVYALGPATGGNVLKLGPMTDFLVTAGCD